MNPYVNRYWLSTVSSIANFVGDCDEKPDIDGSNLVDSLFKSLNGGGKGNYLFKGLFNGLFDFKLEFQQVLFSPSAKLSAKFRGVLTDSSNYADITCEEHTFLTEYCNLINGYINIGKYNTSIVRILTIPEQCFELENGYDIGDILVFLNDLENLLVKFSPKSMGVIGKINRSLFWFITKTFHKLSNVNEILNLKFFNGGK